MFYVGKTIFSINGVTAQNKYTWAVIINKSQHVASVADKERVRMGIFCLLLSPTYILNLRSFMKKLSFAYNSFP